MIELVGEPRRVAQQTLRRTLLRSLARQVFVKRLGVDRPLSIESTS